MVTVPSVLIFFYPSETGDTYNRATISQLYYNTVCVNKDKIVTLGLSRVGVQSFDFPLEVVERTDHPECHVARKPASTKFEEMWILFKGERRESNQGRVRNLRRCYKAGYSW